MAAVAGKTGGNAKIKFGTATGMDDQFAQLRSVSLSLTRGEADISHAASANNWREFLPTMHEATMSAEVIFDADQFPSVITSTPIMLAAEVITLTWDDQDDTSAPTNNATFASSGFITSWETSAPYDGEMTANVEFRLTGVPTFTPVA